ncbi:DNA-binding response regulator [Bifidobacterium dolichotidis]|uniref:Sensory transduction protein RegX3 n=1 Tax=Bifidobacterium dolichotidis TaxID=2306976 RepID=A0A430FQA1_9BIFI|nr:response regulator transcription factor [Bifidobacterium dolichotidis]RSX55023.1 DNA-binding response regulator [Bifidobacterium dolichotidis]
MTRILIVEDEQSYLEPLTYQLTREQYEVIATRSGEEGFIQFLNNDIDLVLLDLMMPGMDGISLCQRIREQSRVPIIMLTAKSAELDKVVGLEAGADDYVTKPYSFRELLARIHAVLRRQEKPENSDVITDDETPLSCAHIQVHVASHVVMVHGKEVFFPLKEFEVLTFLIRNRGRVVNRQQIIDRVWGSDYVGDTKTLDVHIKRIRSKIEDNPAQPKLLTTVRGVGYKIDE